MIQICSMLFRPGGMEDAFGAVSISERRGHQLTTFCKRHGLLI
jgi:hypothetical protein